MSKRIIASALVFVTMVFCLCPSGFAVDYTSEPSTFWDRVIYNLVVSADNVPVFGDGLKTIAGLFSGDVCDLSEDGLHHTDTLQGANVTTGKEGTCAWPLCNYCQENFAVHTSDVKAAYDTYVQNIQTDYGSDCFGSDGGYWLSSHITSISGGSNFRITESNILDYNAVSLYFYNGSSASDSSSFSVYLAYDYTGALPGGKLYNRNQIALSYNLEVPSGADIVLSSITPIVNRYYNGSSSSYFDESGTIVNGAYVNHDSLGKFNRVDVKIDFDADDSGYKNYGESKQCH